jgi:hypothetical protein
VPSINPPSHTINQTHHHYPFTISPWQKLTFTAITNVLNLITISPSLTTVSPLLTVLQLTQPINHHGQSPPLPGFHRAQPSHHHHCSLRLISALFPSLSPPCQTRTSANSCKDQPQTCSKHKTQNSNHRAPSPIKSVPNPRQNQPTISKAYPCPTTTRSQHHFTVRRRFPCPS